MFKVLAGILLTLTLYSCVTPSENYQRIVALKKANIGIIALNQDGLSDSTFSLISEVYNKTVPGVFKRSSFKSVQFISGAVSMRDSNLAQAQITQICKQNNLDAVIVSEISNVRMYKNDGSVRVRPDLSTFGVGVRFDFLDTETPHIELDFEMKLVGNDGKLLMDTFHGSKQGSAGDGMSQNDLLESIMRSASNTIINKIKQKRY